jgi:long-chain acyl-CoA synthetase
MPADVIPERLMQMAAQRPGAVAYAVRSPSGSWIGTSWSRYAEEVREAGLALIAAGVEPGERVAILGNNRPEWTILTLGALSVGAIPVGIYTTSSPSEVTYILRHSGARVVLVEDATQAAKVDCDRADLPELMHVVGMRGLRDRTVIPWETFLAGGAEIDRAEADARLEALRPDDDAVFIYTSGTTGPPKAVRLTHDNLAFTAAVGRDAVGIGPDDRMISYLPLSHIAEQLFSIHIHVSVGYHLFFATSMEALREHIPEVRPTILFGVPRVWEKMYAGIQGRLGALPPARRALVDAAMAVGRQVGAYRNRGEALPWWLRLRYALFERLVYLPFKRAVGLQDLRMGVSAAAPISADLLAFFHGLDVDILEVYGQSEGTGPTSFNLPGRTRLGTVGQAMPGVEVRVAEDDGEILVRGRNVFAGYYLDDEATRAALSDGWLRSGDLGALDADGYLTITGRKKDILITAGGKNVSPAWIEGLLLSRPWIAQAVLLGDRRPYLTALLWPDPAVREAWLAQAGVPPEAADDAVRDAIQADIDAHVNPQLARVEGVRRIALLPHELDVAHGELTPTMKVRRGVITNKYAHLIDDIYARPGRT